VTEASDRLFQLLPVVYRQRDAEQGWPLRALLRVVAEQVDVVEADIAQLYENWFIETCQDWVVPYIGDLVGCTPVPEAGEPGNARGAEGTLRNRILNPRRDVANTLRYRRRKGTLALLELLANDVAGWPARAVEFYRLLSFAQHVNHVRLERGRTTDLRDADALDVLDGPFDRVAHVVDVRRLTSHRTVGRYNIPSVGLFVWRLRSYSVTKAPAYCVEEASPTSYTFSVLGNDAPLFTHPEAEVEPSHIAEEINVPTPIGHRALDRRREDYYGPGKSFHIRAGASRELVPPGMIVAADLTGWRYQPRPGFVAVDPVLGRIAFPPRQPPKEGVWVSYHYGFSADIGGGEYHRQLVPPARAKVYRVGEAEQFHRITEAIAAWTRENAQWPSAVIEITDSGVYSEQLAITLAASQSLQIRAADRRRPVIRLLDWQTALPDALRVKGASARRFELDGVLITGRGVELQGELGRVCIRHSTLVPGWGLQGDCEPRRPTEPSLVLFNLRGRLAIERSIMGAIQVNEEEVGTDPLPIQISDSILDATDHDRIALSGQGQPVAHAVLTIARATVLGHVQAHAVELAENTIFTGCLTVARRQRGCIRFCFVPPESRTPRRHHCQPDLVDEATERGLRARTGREPTDAEIEVARAPERNRVTPQFNSTRYGSPTYCQLADECAVEIVRGADDESEMGVFHDLFQPQRDAMLRARLAEYTPAGMDAGVLHAS